MAIEIRTTDDSSGLTPAKNIYYTIYADSESEIIAEREKIYRMFNPAGYGTSAGIINFNKVMNKYILHMERMASCD